MVPRVEPLLPVRIERGGIQYAPGVRAGRWVFATGLLATDFKHGLAQAVFNPRYPHGSRPKAQREADFIFERLGRILAAGGTALGNVVRLDQYYPSWKAVDPYHRARREAFGAYVPPSTSILERELLLPDAFMDVQAVAIIPEGRFRVHSLAPKNVDAPPESGYAPVVTAGDYVFVAGQLARGPDGGLAAEAQVPRSYLWKGTQIALETEYLIRHRLAPALQAAGSSLANVVKAQVYLTDIGETSGFLQAWTQHFGAHVPATTIVPTAVPGLNTAGATIEVNLLALRDGGATRKEPIALESASGFGVLPAAVRAGDLLLLTGLLATEAQGPIAEAERDPRQPYFGSPIQAQMRHILAQAERLCQAVGASLDDVVRIQQFHTDLAEFYPACQVWQERMPGRALPFSAIGVPGPLAVPGCSVLLDLWVYAGEPGRAGGSPKEAAQA